MWEKYRGQSARRLSSDMLGHLHHPIWGMADIDLRWSLSIPANREEMIVDGYLPYLILPYLTGERNELKEIILRHLCKNLRTN